MNLERALEEYRSEIERLRAELANAAHEPSEAIIDAEARGFAVGREHAQYLIEERDAEIERLRALLAQCDAQ